MSIFRGINFPFKKKDNKLPAPVTDENLIEQSLIQIVMTQKGERPMRQNFGTDVLSFVFENGDMVRSQILKSSIMRAISTFEKRVSVRFVDLALNDNTLLVVVHYVIVQLQKEKKLEISLPALTTS